MYELSTGEFLYSLYIKVLRKIELIKNLSLKNNLSLEEQKILFLTKENMANVFIELSINTNNEELELEYLKIAQLFISRDIKDILRIEEILINIKNN